MPENYQDTAFRVLNGDSEGIPSVTIDFYGGFIIVQFYSESMAGMGKYIYPALESIVKPIGCYEQRRFKSLGGKAPEQKGATHQFGAAAPVEFSVSEHGLKFLVDVTSPLSTGLFTDLRAGRDLVRRHAKNRNVLNLFSYTGAFSVYAHAGGAASITSVDTAPKGHARSRKNFAANGMEEDACQYMVADARAQLAKFKSRDRFFDLTIVDPPAFGSPVKRGQQPWVAMRDYADVVADVLAVTSPNGFVFAVSSTHKMSEEHYRSALSDAALKAKRQIHTLETVKLPWDYLVHPSFPEGDYLKATLLIVD